MRLPMKGWASETGSIVLNPFTVPVNFRAERCTDAPANSIFFSVLSMPCVLVKILLRASAGGGGGGGGGGWKEREKRKKENNN